MRMAGIVAEYDPFHKGHAWQLKEARRLTGADAVVVVMSGFFTQRGAPACLSPLLRAACALESGADAVLLLPAAWSLRSAEGFALGAMAILRGAGADAVSFGAETPDPALLQRAAALQDDPAVREALRRGLASGLGWAAAMQAAAASADAEAGEAMGRPNNTLGLAYMRAARSLGWAPDFVPVQRLGEHADAHASAGFASGTAVRAAMAANDRAFLHDALPPWSETAVLEAMDSGSAVAPDALDQALLARLRTMDTADYAALPDCSEGIEQALRKAASKACTQEELIGLVSGRRYPRARVRRLCASALLGLRKEDTETLPDAAVVLACRPGSEKLLAAARPGFRLCARSREDPAEEGWYRAECRAADLWALAAGKPSGLLRSRQIKASGKAFS